MYPQGVWTDSQVGTEMETGSARVFHHEVLDCIATGPDGYFIIKMVNIKNKSNFAQ